MRRIKVSPNTWRWDILVRSNQPRDYKKEIESVYLILLQRCYRSEVSNLLESIHLVLSETKMRACGELKFFLTAPSVRNMLEPSGISVLGDVVV